jgi:hypothetical protein
VSHWEAIWKPFLQLFVECTLVCIALGSHWEAIFVAICNVRHHLHSLGELLGNHVCCYLWYGVCAHLHRLGKPLGNQFCCYLSYSCSFALPWQAIRKQFLLRFAGFAIICIASGSHWEAMFAAICNVRGHLHCLGKPLGHHWGAIVVAIWNVSAHLRGLGKPMGSHFCCYLRDAENMEKLWGLYAGIWREYQRIRGNVKECQGL